MDRRDFLRNSAGLGLSLCVAKFLTSCESYSVESSPYSGIDVTLDLTDREVFTAEEYVQLGKIDHAIVKRFRDGKLRQYSKVNYGIPVVILRLNAEGQFAVFSSMCTHAQCLMIDPDTDIPKGDYRGKPGLEDYSYFNCHCHGSQFDPFQGGIAIHGPAEKALKKFECEYDPLTEKLTIHF